MKYNINDTRIEEDEENEPEKNATSIDIHTPSNNHHKRRNRKQTEPQTPNISAAVASPKGLESLHCRKT